ncbi:PAS domain S-box protein [bacterium]|nr:PAS domain S-box protein [bacterium]
MDIVRPWLKFFNPMRLLIGFTVFASLISIFLVQSGGSELALLILVAPILLAAHFGGQRYYLVGLFALTLLSIWVIAVTSPNLPRSLAILTSIFAGVFVASEGIYQLSRYQQRALGGLYTTDQWFRSIFADSPIGIELFDGDGHLIDVNRAGLALFGVSSVEAVKGFQLFNDPNVTDEVKALLRRGQTVHYTNRFDFETVKAAKLYETSRRGSAELDVLITPLGMNAQRDPEGYLVLAQDITEQLSQKRALQESEAMLRAIFNASDDGIVLSDEDGVIIEFSQGMERITGWSRQKLLGTTIWEMQHLLTPNALKEQVDQDAVRHAMQSMLQSGLSSLLDTPIETNFQHYDGSVRTVEQQGFAIPTESGFRLGSICHDISERHRTAAALRKSEERYRILAEMSSDAFAIFQVDEEGLLHPEWYTVGAFTSLTSYSLQEWLVAGLPNPENILPEDQAGLHLDRSPGLGTMRQEFRILTRDGQILWLRMRYRFEHNKENRPTFLYVAAEDVTAIKEVEQQALSFRLEKEQTRILTDFIQTASHEFRTPLSVIGLDLHLLQRIHANGPQQPRLSRMNEQVKILGGLVEALLTLSTLDSEAKLEFMPVNLGNIVMDLVAQQQATALANGVTLSVQVTPNLPILFGAPHYLSMAVHGLLDNALRYTPPGGSVILQAIDKGDTVQILISDTGVGISPEILPRVFDRFYRLDEARSTQGFGLGLSIAHKVAERHGGRVGVESEEGKGSLFVLELPMTVDGRRTTDDGQRVS